MPKTHKSFLIPLQISLLIAVFTIINSRTFPEHWSSRFSTNLIEKYLRSQDIPKDVKGRVFLSDGEIHTAAGYLYTKGALPTEYNFQHPPFVKYLFGLSARFFKTTLPVQFLFSILNIALIYLFSLKLTKSQKISFLSTFLFVLDPLAQSSLNSTLLDPGQNFFILLFLYLSLFYPKNYVLQGVSLGLAAASKFWPPAAFFAVATFLYRFYKKNLSLKNTLKIISTSALIFTAAYFPIFLKGKGLFYFIWFQAKVIKYWLDHSISSLPGNNILLFTTGFFKSWWGEKGFLRSSTWSPLWPVLLVFNLIFLWRKTKKKELDKLFFVSFLPVGYLLYTTLQAPFDRYFLLILPLGYLITVKAVYDIIRK